jgi:beta-fructofuranosidase
MLFAPENPLHGLWDTWILPANGEYHLFYLKRDMRDMWAKIIGHAVSPDLVHWQPVADAINASPAPAWDSGWFMTGTVVRHHDGRYYMFYGSMIDQIQRIGVAISDDLMYWEKYAGGPVLEASAPYYETDPKAAPNGELAWRDPCILWDEEDQCYYAFICARVPGGDYTGGACVAVSRSTDLLHWKNLPPAYTADDLVCMEVPDVFKLNGRYYMMYSTALWFNSYYVVRDRHMVNGTFYLQSDQLLSGWHHPPHGDSALLASREQRLDSYVGRSVLNPADGARLYYHHMVRHEFPSPYPKGSLGLVKQLEVLPDGQLVAQYRRDINPYTQTCQPDTPVMCGQGIWAGTADHLSVKTTTAAAHLSYQAEDHVASVDLHLEKGSTAAGLMIGFGCLPAQCFYVVLNANQQQLEIGLCRLEEAGQIKRQPYLQARQQAILPNTKYALRVVLCGHFLEVYVDQVARISFVCAAPPYGLCGLYAEAGESGFDNYQVEALHLKGH